MYGSVQSGILYDVQNEVLDAQDLHNCMSIYASALVFIKMYQLTLIIHHHEISAIYIYIYYMQLHPTYDNSNNKWNTYNRYDE